MKLYEHEAKRLFASESVPIPKGVVVRAPSELRAAEWPVVLKSQVLVGGRGKAGGIRFAANEAEARRELDALLRLVIKGHPVRSVLVEERLTIKKELYASILVDRSSRLPLFLVSAEGGVEIESVADSKIVKETVNPLTGLQPFHIRNILSRLPLSPEEKKAVAKVLEGMYRVFAKYDAELVEVNPLAILADGRAIAADGKVVLDDSAGFRHKDIAPKTEEHTALEAEAHEQGIAFVQLDGRIGVIANGAGLTMSTLDALTHFGGKGGVFLDLGGTDDPEKVKVCFRLLAKARPSVILLNLFGGITKCDTVAKGVKAVLDEERITIPIVTRIKGVNEEEARQILKDAGLITARNLREAAELTVKTEREGLAKGAT
ncbi:MAG: ADP-forming succinate--CoA ligase subunit beta [Methanobacteriota archaeon]